MNEKFCKVPFSQLEIGPTGECRVCCKMESTTVVRDDYDNPYILQNTDIKTIWNSKWMNNIRQRFINGEQLEECKICWDDEAAGIKSYRQKSNQFIDMENFDNPIIKDLMLKTSNKCNSACRICNSYLSSLWQSEDEKYGKFRDKKFIELNSQDKINDNNWENWKETLRNVRSISIFGGEPLINPEILKVIHFLIDEDLASNVGIVLNTNGTVTSAEMFDTLNKFNFVSLCFSIDDIDERYHYERWPASFDSIYKGLLSVHDREYKNIHISLYTTISVFNILNLGDILERFKTLNKWNINFDNLLYIPEYVCLYNLPEEIKPKIEEYLDSVDWNQKWLANMGHENIKSIIINFMNLYKSPYSCNDFIKLLDDNLGPVDIRRNQDWKKTFPKLYALLTK